MKVKRMYRPAFCSLFLFLTCSHEIFSLEESAESTERAKIISLLQKWPQNFNAGNTQEVCELFAPDLVASYPGTSDKNYADMCRGLSVAMTGTEKKFHYEAPEFEQILIDEDLAVVRLVWTLKISEKNTSDGTINKEKGLDVFKRQPDGRWKIIISYAYPLE